jgi:ribosome-binding protein aMBF1 (putative translation factor)
MSTDNWIPVTKKSKTPEDTQDWTPIILKGASNSQPPKTHTVKRAPETSTASGIPAWKIEQQAEEGILKPKTVPLDIKLKIQQGRQAKKWTQKELAQRTNLPVNLIQSYENGTAIPNGKELSLINRALK